MAIIRYSFSFFWLVVFLIVDIFCYDTLKQEFIKSGLTADLLGTIILLLFITFVIPGIMLIDGKVKKQ